MSSELGALLRPALLVLVLALATDAGAASGSTPATAYLRAAAAARTLVNWYDWGRCPWYEPWVWWHLCHAGTFQPSAGVWNSANALTTIANFTTLSGDATYVGLIHHAFDSRGDGDSMATNYVDDEGWWALAWIGAAEVDAADGDRRARELARAESVFRDMDRYWDAACGGGVWWRKEPRHYKNAIANELYMAVAARLYRATGDVAYWRKAWAAYDWFFAQSTLYRRHALIPDGIVDGTCGPSGPTLDPGTFTYNQGVILGALVAMDDTPLPPGVAVHPAVREDPCAGHDLLRCAEEIADVAIEKLTDDDGILTEDSDAGGDGGESVATEPDHRPQGRHRRDQRAFPQDCLGPDCPQFKGIFVRNVGALARALSPSAATSRYARFLQHNAQSLWARDRLDARGRVFFGPYWQGPFGFPNATVQTAALDVLVEAMSLEGQAAAGGAGRPAGAGGRR